MGLSSRQLVVLAAPLVVAYLTYSTVERGATMMRAVAATQTPVASKTRMRARAGATAVRNPFAPVGAAGILSAVLDERTAREDAQAEEEKGLLMTLNGTVIAPRWRFAIIDGERVVEGQRYMGFKVERIDAERVVLSDLDGVTTELELQIAKVVAPTEEAMPADAPAAFSSVNGAAPPDILDLLGIPKG